MKTKQLRVKNNKFHMIADEEMLQLIHDGDSQGLDFLIDRYRGFVLAKARSYFLIGGDSEDIIQEGMIGLYKAICDFDSNKYTSFKGFANLCITRQMITAIKTATRQKHMPLNTSVSLDKPVYDEESERTLIDIIVGSEGVDPQELLISREKLNHFTQKISKVLSNFEERVLHLYLDGFTYQEISKELRRHVKSIDNALQRVKRKLEHTMDQSELVM